MYRVRIERCKKNRRSTTSTNASSERCRRTAGCRTRSSARRSACRPRRTLRRVKRLEEAGVIAGYVALVSARHVGLGLTAYINVRMEKHTGGNKRSPMDVFAAAVQTWPEVVECVSLTGEMDYLLRIVVADMGHYTRFVMDTLLKHSSVQDCKTSFVMRPIKSRVTLV
jgi:Lrp/AsnC family leucine-responsive transcriptional regulator